MPSQKNHTISTNIQNIKIDSLKGRMMIASSNSNSKRKILLVYGQHASLERMQAFAEELSLYGNVVMPDLPGFGGMQSLYKINREPNLETMADYLATFVRTKCKRHRLSIVAVSYGFLVATRMLQKYPDIAKKVDILVPIAGFAHHDDFLYTKRTKNRLRFAADILQHRPIAWFVQHFLLVKPFIKASYRFVRKRHVKMKDADNAEFNKRTDFEVKLWRMNDFRTRMRSGLTMLSVDLCKVPVRATNIKVYFVAIEDDQYFDIYKVEQRLRVIYEHVECIKITMSAHMPTVVASRDEVAPFIPKQLRKALQS